MRTQIANLMLAQQELVHARKKGLPLAAEARIILAQQYIAEAIRECEKEQVPA